MSPWISGKKKVWPGVLEEVPTRFSTFLAEPAFSMGDATFCIWQSIEDSAWHCGRIDYPEGDDPDGSENLVWMLDADPVTYQEFAGRYYERPVSLELVRQIYDHAPLTEDLAHKLNSDVSWDALQNDALEIGYPLG